MPAPLPVAPVIFVLAGVSEQGDPATGTIPKPKLLLHWRGVTIVAPTREFLETTPEWARAIIARALQLQRAHGKD